MPTVSAGNARVHYRTEGSGPRLVLVHGTGFGADGTWGHLVENFTDRHTVVLPDFAGCGETEDDGGELTAELLAEQIAGVIEATGDGPVDLVGFSLGAVVSATLAATRPELVRRLVLTAGWARPDDGYLRNHMTTWLAARADEDAFGRFGTLTAFSRDFLNLIGPEQVELIVKGNRPTAGALRHIGLNLRADLRELLPRITAETLVIGCAKDATVPVELTRELAAAVPGSRYTEIDSGHVVVYENPAAFVQELRTFLS